MANRLQLRSITGLVLVAAVATSLPLAAGFFGSLHPALDSFAHFRVHLAILLIVLAAALLPSWLRRAGLAAMLLGLGAVATVSGIPFMPRLGPVHAAFQSRDQTGPTYRLLQLNLRLDNWDPGKVLALIRRVQPDVITLEEFSADWATRLAPFRASYPHQLLCYEVIDDGVAILSRHPFADSRAADCSQDDAMAIAALDLDGRQLDIAAVHLLWPWPFDQAQQIDELSQALGSLAETAILSGDLNAVSWSAAAVRVQAAGDFAPTIRIGPTWLYYRLPDWLRFAGLPIDHVLTKGNAILHSARTLDTVGSDHLPLLVEFSLRSTSK